MIIYGNRRTDWNRFKAYVTKETLDTMKREIKYHGGMSARLMQTDKEIKMVWIEEK